jgi:proteasome lid subunit RPN8/RPN11
MIARARFGLPFRERRRLHDRAYRAQQRNHLEVCGALVADKRASLRLVFLKNQTDKPNCFSIARTDLRKVRESSRMRGHRVLGIFHSHPVGYAQPGPRDRRASAMGSYMLIYDVCAREPKLWQITRRGKRRRAFEVALRLDPRPPNKALKLTAPRLQPGRPRGAAA